MIKFVILMFSACVLQTTALSLPSNRSERIIGGDNAFAGEFPYMAAIYKRTSTGTYFCAGVLVHEQWVLTAGQCVVDGILFTIRLGSNSLSKSDPNVITLATEHYVLYPDFNPTTLEHDLGFIKFRQPIQFTDYVRQVGGYLGSELYPEEPVVAIGWGQTGDEEPGLHDELQRVSLVTLSNEECKVTYGSQVLDSMVCAAGNYNEGLCQGDIGGPLFIRISISYFLVGIASFVSGRGCENTDPSGFQRTGPYINWILDVPKNDTKSYVDPQLNR